MVRAHDPAAGVLVPVEPGDRGLEQGEIFEKQAAAMKKDAEDRINAEIARARRLLEAEVVSVAVKTFCLSELGGK